MVDASVEGERMNIVSFYDMYLFQHNICFMSCMNKKTGD